MIQDVFIIGATGKVGGTLVEHIINKGDTDVRIHANPTRIVGIASSTHFIYSPEGIEPEQAFSFSKNRDFDNAQAYDELMELSEAVNKSQNKKSSLVFVDATALNEPMTKFHLHIIRDTSYSFVTANKNPIALSDYPTFTELTQNPRRYGYRCSVMAGAEAVQFLQDIKDLNDPLKLMQGCFSGTLGYVCSELETGKKFSEIVREAFRKGYTEPHPRDDLNGLDVARKLVVLSRTAGYKADMADVKVKPFIPPEYLLEGNVDNFLDKMQELDDSFKEKIASIRKNGMALRYAAQMQIQDNSPLLEVSLKEVPEFSPLGALKDTLNKIVIVSETYPQGYSIEAPGAGLDVTARNIRRDLLHLLEQRRIRV